MIWRVVLVVVGVWGLAQQNVRVPGDEEPKQVSVCDIVKNPLTYSGHLVRVQGDVVSNFEFLALSDDCSDLPAALDLESPDNVEPPNRPSFDVNKDDMLALFHEILDRYGWGGFTTDPKAPVRPRRGIRVTLVGRLDGPDKLTYRRGEDIVTRRGFGHLGQFRARLVIRSVDSVTVSR